MNSLIWRACDSNLVIIFSLALKRQEAEMSNFHPFYELRWNTFSLRCKVILKPVNLHQEQAKKLFVMYKAATFVGKSSFSFDQVRLGKYFVHTHAHIIYTPT